jgi:L-ascorbate 6-phosphate lactonase
LTMKLTWLGQGGYLIEQAETRLVVDPYLTDALAASHGLRRLAPPPVSIDEMDADVVFVTHDHLDHFDPETLEPLMGSSTCMLIGPQSVIAHGRRLGIKESRLLEVCVGETVSARGFRITATPAVHSDPHAIGILVNGEDRLAYISGDTLYDASLADSVNRLAGRPLDAAMVCINGRLGNMNIEEAAELVAALKPGVAVPMHYGMFAENTADPQQFVAACRTQNQNTLLLETGASVQL